MKKVKILLSSYNGEKYITEQLESLFYQDYPNIDIYVRDDGSGINTLKILREFSLQGKINLIEGENIGFVKSFWFLLNNCGEADYYAFCDQDDVWDKDKISRAVLCLEKEEKIPLLYCSNTRVVDANRNLLIKDIIYPNIIESYFQALIRPLAPGCTFVFNNEAALLLKMIPSDSVEFHDWVAHKTIALLGKVIKDGKSSMDYRQHGNNLIGYNYKKMNALKVKILRLFKRRKGNTRQYFAERALKIFDLFLSPEVKADLQLIIGYKNSLKDKLLFYKRFRKSFQGIQKIKLFILILREEI